VSKLRVKTISVCAIIIIIFSQGLQHVISYLYTLSSSLWSYGQSKED